MSSGLTAAAARTGELWDAAQRLRTVRRAHERFLALWAVERLVDAAAAHVQADLDGLFDGPIDGGSADGPDGSRGDVRIVDSDRAGTPDNHALPADLQRRLFRGGRLDD